MESTLDSVLFFIVGLLIASWIIKKRLETGILRAIGIYLVTTVFGLIAASPIKPFVVQAYKIPSSAMAPTLLVGDHILTNKFIYHFRNPVRGEVIVFPYPRDKSKDFLMRVIGLPGEKIEIIGEKILVNDVPIEDPWGHYTGVSLNTESASDRYGPKIVPPNSLFVLGDNRDNSQDSRYWGFVNMSEVKDRVSSIYFSWDWRARRVRWERIGRAVE
ncbi:MAG: signal peptidase I [Candidatus Aenigmarchaeota archaeon]|nr:signal peptidase I [Candidatus Aenigmarchaeota archaeon]